MACGEKKIGKVGKKKVGRKWENSPPCHDRMRASTVILIVIPRTTEALSVYPVFWIMLLDAKNLEYVFPSEFRSHITFIVWPGERKRKCFLQDLIPAVQVLFLVRATKSVG